jgi:hypothetical protein
MKMETKSLLYEKKDLDLIQSAIDYDSCGGDMLTFYMDNSPNAPKYSDDVTEADLWFFIFVSVGNNPSMLKNYLRRRDWGVPK